MKTEVSEVVRILCVNPSKLKKAYEGIGTVEILEDNAYLVEVPYDNGIFRLRFDGYDFGSITYQSWGTGIRQIAGFEIHDNGPQYASSIELKTYEHDAMLIGFLSLVAEKVKKRLN
jgi:hypothetical protein